MLVMRLMRAIHQKPMPQYAATIDEDELAQRAGVRLEIGLGEDEEQRDEAGDDAGDGVHRGAGPLAGDLDAAVHARFGVGRGGEVLEHGADMAGAGGAGQLEGGDDEVADGVGEVVAELVEHDGQRFVGEALGHLLHLGANRQRRRRGGGDEHAFEAAGGADAVAQHLGPQRDGFGAGVEVAAGASPTGQRDVPARRDGGERGDGPAGHEGDDQTNNQRHRHALGIDVQLATAAARRRRAPGADR